MKQRVAFVLCDVEGHTSAEAASVLGTPEATVRTRLFHARKALRERLGQEGAP
jgi:RNA polymerase sigma-70 factor, ECF subfamily